MILPQTTLERAFDELLERVRQHPQVAEEFQASWAEFSLSEARPGGPHGAAMSQRRHAEWFLLERPSAALDSVPALSLTTEPGEKIPDDWESGCDALLGSFASVFEVTGVSAGEGLWIRDLAGVGEYPLEDAEVSRALSSGDLLVGRIFPVGDALSRISHASGCFRDPALLSAVRRDLQRAREGRRGVLRLSQRDLEAMFFSASVDPAPAGLPGLQVSPVAEARAILARGGLAEAEIDDVFAGLASEPFDPTAVLPGAGDRLGEILATLAFETEVDLEAARRALALAWPDLSSPPSRREPRPEAVKGSAREPSVTRGNSGAKSHKTKPSTPIQKQVEAALSDFDRKRASGADLESTFAELERVLELEPDSTADVDAAPDFPGVVGAMVVEFLWEMDRERGAAAARPLAAIANFAQFAEERSVFENLGERDLLLYACLWLPEHAPSGDEASRWFVALGEFCDWAEAQHGVLLSTALSASRAGLAEALPRAVELNGVLRGPRKALQSGGEMAVYEAPGLARTSRGEPRPILAPAEFLARLAPGDFLRLKPAAGESFDVLCVYPPQTARLANLP